MFTIVETDTSGPSTKTNVTIVTRFSFSRGTRDSPHDIHHYTTANGRAGGGGVGVRLSIVHRVSDSEPLKRNIHSEAKTICNKSETCRKTKCVHCHIISSADVSIAINKLKSDKVNDNGLVYSNNFNHGTELLFQYLSILFTSMIHHGFCPPTFICANIIPIPKSSKANLSDSDKYRSIAISSLLGKILDHIIIVKQSEALKTSNYQFGFKANSSTVLCSTIVNEIVQYYTENGAKPVYVLLLDASKAFDKVAFNVLFNELRGRSLCPKITQLLYYMYTNQQCSVRRGSEHSDYFNVSNGVKHGGVISPILFSCYIDKLFSQLEHSGLGCHVGASYARAFGYADDIALVAPSLQSLTLSDPCYFRQLTIRGGALKAPPPPTTISKTIVSIVTISYM